MSLGSDDDIKENCNLLPKSLQQWPSQVTDDTWALHIFVFVGFFFVLFLVRGGWSVLGACSPSKLLHLRGSYSDCF